MLDYIPQSNEKQKNFSYYVDGGVSGNGNFGNQKAVICGTSKSGTQIFWEEVGDKTSNEAELLAILRILQKTTGVITIYSDSELAVRLVGHQYLTKIDRLQTILKDIQKEQRIFKLIWKPREKNKAGMVIQERLGL